MTEQKKHKINPLKVKCGDLMTLTHWVKVKNPSDFYHTLIVSDLDNDDLPEIHIRGKQLVENAFSADQFVEEENVTKTVAAEILVSSHNRPLTVCFKKQDGSERVIRGRLLKHEALLGRSMVEDLDTPKGDKRGRLRQVDHRTIHYLIVDGVKYLVK